MFKHFLQCGVRVSVVSAKNSGRIKSKALGLCNVLFFGKYESLNDPFHKIRPSWVSLSGYGRYGLPRETLLGYFVGTGIAQEFDSFRVDTSAFTRHDIALVGKSVQVLSHPNNHLFRQKSCHDFFVCGPFNDANLGVLADDAVVRGGIEVERHGTIHMLGHASKGNPINIVGKTKFKPLLRRRFVHIAFHIVRCPKEHIHVSILQGLPPRRVGQGYHSIA
mmetsp:Transcript_21143/g.45919  ORF Transcript_21143/g.45919 Transcript_21143/m.45919 type:complete len:220 (+) Transcript_21143:120-779(+)